MSRATGRSPDSRRLHRAPPPDGFDERLDHVGQPGGGWARRHTSNGACFWSRAAPGDEHRDGYRKHTGRAGMGPARWKPPSAPLGVGPRGWTAVGWPGRTGHPPRRRGTDGARVWRISAWSLTNAWSSNEVRRGGQTKNGAKAQGLPPPLQEGGSKTFEREVKRRWTAWHIDYSRLRPRLGLRRKTQLAPTFRWVVVGAPETSRLRSSKSADVRSAALDSRSE